MTSSLISRAPAVRSVHPDSGRPRGSGMVLAIILACYLMIVLDLTIVITALPRIRHALDFSATGLS